MARKKTREEQEYDVVLANVREVCKTSYGRDFIWYVLSFCRIADDCFTGNSTTFYNEGQRAIGLQIMQLLDDADLSIYPRLLLEKRKIEVEHGPDESDSGPDTGTEYGSDD